MARTFVRASNHKLDGASAVLSAYPLTMGCWFNTSDADSNQTLMSIGDNTVSANYIALLAKGDTIDDPLRLFMTNVSDGGAFSSVNTTTGYSADTWHHAGLVLASSTDRRIFIDGGSKGTDTSSQTFPTVNETSIGRLASRNPEQNTIDGLIAEAAVWNVALTDAQVALLAKGVSPLMVEPQSLVAYWPLIGRHSPEIDIVGGFDLTVTGATAGDHPRVFYPAHSRVSFGAAAAPPSEVGPANQLGGSYLSQPTKRKIEVVSY